MGCENGFFPNPALNPAPTLPEPCARSIRELIFAAVSNRIVLAIDGGTLRATGPRSVAELGRELMGRKADVMAWLGVWQSEAMSALEYETDGVVERLGVSGTDDVIRTAAERCVRAHYAGDTLGVVAECQVIQIRASELARPKSDPKAKAA